MHITTVSLVNYRNFKNVKFQFNKGINTIIGENGSGKSNLFRAIRLLLDDSMPRSSIRLCEGDFCRMLDNWRGHWIIISIEFNDIANDEATQALFCHGLANADSEKITKATYNLIFRPKANIRKELSNIENGNIVHLNNYLANITIDDYETVLTGKSNVNFNDQAVYKSVVGDFDAVIFPEQLNNADIGILLPNILNMTHEVSFTFIKALRDVVSDFHNNRTNPLLKLLKSKSCDINKVDFEPIKDLIKDLNSNIEGLSDVCKVRDDIVSTINDTMGNTYSPNAISIRSSLTDESEQLFQSLKLFVAESNDNYEGAIHEMSLGGANLLYLTLKLLEFKYQKSEKSIAKFLLIEEPEAHIHTHIQKTLFNNINYENTQIIYSTHSSHISEVSNIENMNIIGYVNNVCEVFQPSINLNTQQIGCVERFLDAIRSNLLFARSVILVEGDAEEILIPILFKKVLGVSLDEIGISLINIRSTGFENIAILFSDERIKKRCSIITDLDAPFFDITILKKDTESEIKRKNKAKGSEKSGKCRKLKLEKFCTNNPWIKTFYSDHTFEVDFIKASNEPYLKKIVETIYTDPATITQSIMELSSTNISVSGLRALTMANYHGKGWFALILGNVIDFKVKIPEYIFNAIKFAHGNFNKDLVYKIIKHRYESIIKYVEYGQQQLETTQNTKQGTEWEEDLSHYENGLKIFTPKWEAFDLINGDINTIKNNFVDDFLYEKNGILARI